jgi:arylsulfatase A-like enzyme
MNVDRHAPSRRQVLGAGAGLAASLALGSRSSGAPSKPNIVLIVADDLGYGELSIQGCRDIPTPNIDSIAREGARFTSGYVSCPVCSPTRAGLMTGRYQQRFGHEHNPGPENAATADFGLAADERTLAERLKEAGYATGIVGKWHLGYKPDSHPMKRGFDEFFGFLGGAHPYSPQGQAAGRAILRGTERVNEQEYLTDAFAREATAFIGRHKARPFFLYLPFNAVHAPLQASAKYTERVAAIADPKRRTFASMTFALDDAVGAVLAKLREHGLERNTLVLFISDNGGPTPQTSSGNGALRGFKGQVLEGGIRVPFLARWTGRIKPGTVIGAPAIALDIHPTALAAAGWSGRIEKPLDGVNLLPVLTGRKLAQRGLFWRFGPQSAARLGDWKLVNQGSGPQLYNLAEDIHEDNDLCSGRPDKLREMQAAYDRWNKEMIPAKWGRQGGTAPRRAARGRGADVESMFRTLDKDGDGKLTAAELGRPSIFRRMDADGDGFATIEEARKFYGGRTGGG